MLRLSSPATATGVTASLQRPQFEVADVVHQYGAAFRATLHVSHAQERVLQALVQCRTAALGGHVEACEACGTEQICYNSCRNRHCPQCPGSARAKWLAAEQALLLPVPYFHGVFTLPHLLNPLVRVNQRALYTLLFQTVARTLRQFAHDPPHLGAELGITAVLHTWGQTLTEHIHVHCIVTGGGLSTDGTQWRPSPPRFLFAVEALSQVFRSKYLAGLRRLRAKPWLHFVGESAQWAAEEAGQAVLHQLQDRSWVVYTRPPFGGPDHALKYLSRYVHRVAIANGRLVFVGDGVVRFLYKDSAAGGLTRTKELPAAECLRRFLLHVVPPPFVRIRHFGFLANRTRQEKLVRCRQLLAVVAAAATSALPTPNRETPGAGAAEATPVRCPVCGGGPLRVIAILAAHGGHPPCPPALLSALCASLPHCPGRSSRGGLPSSTLLRLARDPGSGPRWGPLPLGPCSTAPIAAFYP